MFLSIFDTENFKDLLLRERVLYASNIYIFKRNLLQIQQNKTNVPSTSSPKRGTNVNKVADFPFFFPALLSQIECHDKCGSIYNVRY